MTQLSSITGATGAYPLINLSAPFNNITDAVGGGATAGNTVTLSMGAGQTITYALNGLGGTLRRKIGAGAFTAVTDGGTISVVNGDTLQHDYASAGVESATITMTCNGILIGSFTCTGT